MYKVFVDGSVGTTGLRIAQRLSLREEIQLISLSESERKNLNSRINAAKQADITILCLPDEAAKEIVSFLPESVRVCDTSTAHRVNDDWVYGFAEINGRRKSIKDANRVCVPGCHASGFISVVAPLVELGVLKSDEQLTAWSLTGYTGGGKSMIAEYEADDRQEQYDAPRAYALGLTHKHLPEIMKVCGINKAPLFSPIVADFPRGMAVYMPMFSEKLNGLSAQKIVDELKNYYSGEKGIIVHDAFQTPNNGFLPANSCAQSDDMYIYCYENKSEGQILLASVFDNLGKGSSGAAIQCMNIMLNLPERAGLE